MHATPTRQHPSNEGAEVGTRIHRYCDGEVLEHAEGLIINTPNCQAEEPLPEPTQSQSFTEPVHPDVSIASPSSQNDH